MGQLELGPGRTNGVEESGYVAESPPTVGFTVALVGPEGSGGSSATW